MDYSKNKLVLLLLLIWAFQLYVANLSLSFAVGPGDVVINEIAWAGTEDNSNDEWIELYNRSNFEIDLTGWSIDDDGASAYQIVSGSIPAHGFFLIEDRETSISNIQSDAVIGLSLANTGDSLVLKDTSGTIIDSVNETGLAWPSGSSTTKSSMERISPDVSGNDTSNWNSAISSNGSIGATSLTILGTPKSVNSMTMTQGIEVTLSPEDVNLQNGDTQTFKVNVSKAIDLYAFGFDILYDPALLQYISSTEGTFLKKDGKQISFFSSLEDGLPGKLIVGASRLENPETGVSGDGELFSITFKVIGEIETATALSFGPNSYVSDTVGPQSAKFNSAEIISGTSNLSAVKNPKIESGETVYSLKVLWTVPDTGAEKYSISRKTPSGSFALLGETSETTFVDQIDISTGVNYDYKIVAIKNGVASDPVNITGVENRGIKGDIDRNKRVDGRDLEQLARSYGELYGSAKYKVLTDLNYDAIIDGNDLIELGASFGLTY